VYFGVSHVSHPKKAEFRRFPMFGIDFPDLYIHSLQGRKPRYKMWGDASCAGGLGTEVHQWGPGQSPVRGSGGRSKEKDLI